MNEGRGRRSNYRHPSKWSIVEGTPAYNSDLSTTIHEERGHRHFGFTDDADIFAAQRLYATVILAVMSLPFHGDNKHIVSLPPNSRHEVLVDGIIS